jgi:hypothetical protein
MAVFTIQGPDGKTYRVQGNDQAGAINFLKSQIGSQQNAAPAPTAEVNPDGTGVSRAIEKGVRSVYTGGKQFQANILSEKVSQKTQPNAEYLKRALMLRGAQIPPGMDPNNIDVDRVMQFNVLDLGKGTDWRDDVYKFAGLAVKNRDEYFQSGEEAQDFSKLDDLSQEIASQNQKMRDLVRSPGAQNAADRWEAAPDVKSALKSLAVNPLESVAFFGELAAESIPSIAAGSLATLITGNPTVGAGVLVFTSAPRSYNEEVNSFLTENGVDTTDPQSVSDALDNRELMSKANSRGLTKAAIVSAFEALGMKAGGGILKQSAAQGFTGGAGEGVSTKVLDGEVDWKDVWLEGLAELATAPAEATILRNKKGQGTATKEERVQNNAAAASLAQRLRTLSQNNSYNLKDVKKDGGAKQTLESAHEAITNEMKAIVTNPAVKGYLDPKQAKTLEELIDKYAKAQTAIRQTRNKVKSKVDQENYDAILNALPPSKERDQIANLMRESNVLTDLFRSGTKGGVSSFTDTFNPFAREDGSYDPSRMISAGLNKGTAILSAGASLPTQFGIVAGGRTIDAVTRRRAAIDRFVRKNEGKTPLQDPTGPSLVEAEAERQAQAEQLKFEDDQRALELGKLAQSDKDNSPIGTVLLGTGLDRDGLRAAMSELEALNPDIKALKDVFTDIRKNMDGGTNKIRNLNDIIPIINHHLNTPDTTVQRQANPDQLLAQRAGVNIPNVDQSPPAQTQAQTAAPGQPQGQPQSGNQFTTPENYQAGKSDNNAFVRNLESKLADDTTLAPLDKAQLATALADMQASLGPNPVEAMTEMVEDLGNMGVSQEAIDTYVKPYADRVIAQQARVGRLQSPSDTPPAAPTVDQPPAAPTAEQQSPLQQAQQLTEAANSAKDKFAAQDSAKVSDTAPLSEKLEYVNSLERLRTTVLVEGAARKITEGNMDPASVEAMLNQLEQNNPGIKAKILDITGPQQQAEDSPRFQMAIPLFEEPLTIEGKPTVKKIGEAMNQDHLDKVGRQLLPESSPEDYSTVYGYADQELSKQLEQPNSGVGWYSKDVDDSMRLASKVFPTLADNPEHRQLYLTFAGIFSNGADPDNAFMMSAGAFDDFLRTGQIPVNRAQGFYDQGLEPPKTTFKSTKTGKMVTKDAGWGIRNQANEQQLGMLKYLVEREGGLKPAMEFLLTPQKRSDINEVMLDSGLYKAGRFTTKAEKAGADEYGFLAFGKKLGRYSLGLHGVDIDAGDTTIDLWYTRTFRRWTGRLLETPIGKEGVAAQPANDAERDAIFKLTGELAEKYNLPVGDVQALLWFFEKRTWGAQGLNTKEGTNSSGARKLLKERGIDPGQDDDRAGSDGAGVQPSQAPEQPRFNQQPTGVAGILAQRIQGSPNGPTARGAIPDVQEVKGHANHARALVEIGKPRSDYENGIKDQRMVEHLAKAVGVTLKMFDDHNAMLDDGGFTGATRKRGEDAGGVYMRKQNTARSLAPGAKIIRSGQVVAPFRSYLTALHEVAHGIAGRDIDGNLTQNVNMGKNYLTGNQDAAPIDTLEHMIGNLATMPSAKKNKIIKEIMSLQDNESFVGDGVYYGVRPTGPAKKRLEGMLSGSSAKKQLSEDITKFEKYSRSIPEFTVDPLIVYLENPKKMKSVAPETAKAIRAFFVNSSKIRFYSHPLAMAFAVVMAMLMKQEQAEEEERQQQQQMPPGALNQPMPQGMLSA